MNCKCFPCPKLEPTRWPCAGTPGSGHEAANRQQIVSISKIYNIQFKTTASLHEPGKIVKPGRPN